MLLCHVGISGQKKGAVQKVDNVARSLLVLSIYQIRAEPPQSSDSTWNRSIDKLRFLFGILATAGWAVVVAVVRKVAIN